MSDTVDGLATAIGLASATIRRHLDILQRDRLVTYEEVRKKTGRPEYSYFLTEAGHEALPKGYDQLLGRLVQGLSSLSTEDTSKRNGAQILELVFQRLSNQVTDGYESELAGKDMRYRLNALVSHLEREDFSPETEVTQGALHIKLLNCPFRSVAIENKSVCTFDLNLIGNMLDVDVTREQCIHDGDSGCCYTAEIEEESLALLRS